MKFADFMFKAGMMSARPAGKKIFFPEAHDEPGS